MEDQQEKIIVFRAYDIAVEASLAKAKLDAYGIPCFLTDENFTSIYPLRNNVFPGVRLHIFENDHDEATAVLDVKNVGEGFIKCPRCGSFDYERHLAKWERNTIFIAGFFGMFLAASPHREYQCKECKTIFEPA